MSEYRRLQMYAVLIGVALVVVNTITAYLTGLSAFNVAFIVLGLIVIALRGDLAGGTQ